jgi:leader peptidase (prepilin peptidase)/N-methyltransferase
MEELSSTIKVIIYIYTTLIGLLIGSFLNVAALRLSNGESVVLPPSHCPHCKKRLGVFELIPLVSYAWQKGRCKHCGTKVSALYPLGEALTAGLFVLMLWQFGITPELAVALLFASTLVVAFIADSALGLIPFRFVIPALVTMLLLRTWTEGIGVWRYALAIGITYALFFVIAWIRETFRSDGRAAFGGGDVMLFMFIAATSGIKLTLLTLFLASVCGLLFALIGVTRSAEDGRGAVRFAPAILIAAVVSYIWGESLLQLYFETMLTM